MDDVRDMNKNQLKEIARDLSGEIVVCENRLWHKRLATQSEKKTMFNIMYSALLAYRYAYNKSHMETILSMSEYMLRLSIPNMVVDTYASIRMPLKEIMEPSWEYDDRYNIVFRG